MNYITSSVVDSILELIQSNSSHLDNHDRESLNQFNMSLPPLLLERLKRRKIIQETQSRNFEQQSDTTSTKPSESSGLREHELNLGETIEMRGALDQEQEEIIAENYSDEEENEEEEEEEKEKEEERKGLGSDDGCQKDDQHAHKNSSGESSSKGDPDEPSRTSNYNDEDASPKCEQTQHDSRYESVIGCPNKYNIYHECGQYCIDNYSEPESLEPTLEQRKQLALILRAYPMSNEWTVVFDPGVRAFYFWNIISNLVSWLPPGMNGFISMSADQMRKIMRNMGNTQDTLE